MEAEWRRLSSGGQVEGAVYLRPSGGGRVFEAEWRRPSSGG